MELTKRETNNRLTLREKKPAAYYKILHHPQMIVEKKSVALIQLQYNYACNFKCKHCAIEKFKQLGIRSLTISEVESIADQAHKMGIASICISGGEPLVFPDLLWVIAAIGPKRFVISMDTNGYLLDEKMIKWLVEVGVDRVHLSMDGLDSNHDQFRNKKGSWDKTIKALPLCDKHGLGVIVNIVGTRSLVRSGGLLEQLEYLKPYNAHASIIYAKATGAFEDSKDEILDSEDLSYVQGLTLTHNCSTHLSLNCGHNFGCLCFKRHFSITAYGDVLPCPWIPISMGNIRSESLETIVNRGLSNKWFSYDNKFTCHSGNCDSLFYKNIMPQIEKAKNYPADYREIDWMRDYDE
jgi:MoaA/NifB/PqqE/SkfB family radical SAM enzyme